MAENNQETQTFLQRMMSALTHINSTESIDKQRGRITAIITLVIMGVSVLTLLVRIVIRNTLLVDLPAGLQLNNQLLMLISFVFVTYFINRAGFVKPAGILLSAGLVMLALAGSATGLLLPGNAALLIVVGTAIGGLLGPALTAFPLALLGLMGFVIIGIQGSPDFLSLQSGESETAILLMVNLIIVSIMTWLYSRTTSQALEENAEYSTALVAQRQEMEARINRQTRNLQATVTVARAVAGTRDLDKLLTDVVRLVRDTFGFYHVQVFLLDNDDEYAVLRQSTGEVGQKLLERGHRLPVGSLSVIGQVTATGQSVIARDTDMDAVHRRNELLPNTRSEMAIPLKAGDEVIGALDLQSTEPDAFAPEVLPTLNALSDQIAIAIENARLFEQAEESLRELRELSEEISQRSWTEFLEETHEEERRHVVGTEPRSLQVHRSRVMDRVLGSGQVIVASGADGNPSFLAVPVVVRNEVVGVLGVEPDEGSIRDWTQEDLLLLQGISERTALAVENARLYLQAQRAAERERMINTIASRLQRAPSLALLLENAAQELADALGTANVYAEISLNKPLTTTNRPAQISSGMVEAAAREADPGGLAEGDNLNNANHPPPAATSDDQVEEAKAES